MRGRWPAFTGKEAGSPALFRTKEAGMHLGCSPRIEETAWPEKVVGPGEVSVAFREFPNTGMPAAEWRGEGVRV